MLRKDLTLRAAVQLLLALWDGDEERHKQGSSERGMLCGFKERICS